MAYLGEEIKKLGFGMMRLPRIDGEIDIEQSKKMVDIFMNAGFTYFDTAYVYGGSEEAVKKSLVERYPRESYQLATKMAAWVNNGNDVTKQLEESLKRTGAGYIDFYRMHNHGEDRTKKYEELGIWEYLAT
ncbi:MAG: aldo/keto reductase, partial [Clostridia bacterium]|nr:aldo/keto reductase [Clostridia bacterium]